MTTCEILYLRIIGIAASEVTSTDSFALLPKSLLQPAQRQSRKVARYGLLGFSNLLVFGSYLGVDSPAVSSS